LAESGVSALVPGLAASMGVLICSALGSGRARFRHCMFLRTYDASFCDGDSVVRRSQDGVGRDFRLGSSPHRSPFMEPPGSSWGRYPCPGRRAICGGDHARLQRLGFHIASGCWLGFDRAGFVPAGLQPRVSGRHRRYPPLKPCFPGCQGSRTERRWRVRLLHPGLAGGNEHPR